MTRLPMTVVAGYLGAGKTTLINRLLAGDHGLRLMVLVNDFGAINIDERLLASRREDTIALTNGCVCCTMGADLFMALADVLDREPRPDHLIVEASGVSDPTRIANAAAAEPDMRPAGIVTVVDGTGFEGLSQDALIGPQVRQQVTCADLVIVSKQAPSGALASVRSLTPAPVMTDLNAARLLDLVVDDPHPFTAENTAPKHPSYVSWSTQQATGIDPTDMRHALERRPADLFRIKGIIGAPNGRFWAVQVVGRQIDISPLSDPQETGLVAIGLADRIDRDRIETWWQETTRSVQRKD